MVQWKILLYYFNIYEVVPFIFARVTKDLWPVAMMGLSVYVSTDGKP